MVAFVFIVRPWDRIGAFSGNRTFHLFAGFLVACTKGIANQTKVLQMSEKSEERVVSESRNGTVVGRETGGGLGMLARRDGWRVRSR